MPLLPHFSQAALVVDRFLLHGYFMSAQEQVQGKRTCLLLLLAQLSPTPHVAPCRQSTVEQEWPEQWWQWPGLLLLSGQRESEPLLSKDAKS